MGRWIRLLLLALTLHCSFALVTEVARALYNPCNLVQGQSTPCTKNWYESDWHFLNGASGALPVDCQTATVGTQQYVIAAHGSGVTIYSSNLTALWSWTTACQQWYPMGIYNGDFYLIHGDHWTCSCNATGTSCHPLAVEVTLNNGTILRSVIVINHRGVMVGNWENDITLPSRMAFSNTTDSERQYKVCDPLLPADGYNNTFVFGIRGPCFFNEQWQNLLPYNVGGFGVAWHDVPLAIPPGYWDPNSPSTRDAFSPYAVSNALPGPWPSFIIDELIFNQLAAVFEAQNNSALPVRFGPSVRFPEITFAGDIPRGLMKISGLGTGSFSASFDRSLFAASRGGDLESANGGTRPYLWLNQPDGKPEYWVVDISGSSPVLVANLSPILPWTDIFVKYFWTVGAAHYMVSYFEFTNFAIPSPFVSGIYIHNITNIASPQQLAVYPTPYAAFNFHVTLSKLGSTLFLYNTSGVMDKFLISADYSQISYVSSFTDTTHEFMSSAYAHNGVLGMAFTTNGFSLWNVSANPATPLVQGMQTLSATASSEGDSTNQGALKFCHHVAGAAWDTWYLVNGVPDLATAALLDFPEYQQGQILGFRDIVASTSTTASSTSGSVSTSSSIATTSGSSTSISTTSGSTSVGSSSQATTGFANIVSLIFTLDSSVSTSFDAADLGALITAGNGNANVWSLLSTTCGDTKKSTCTAIAVSTDSSVTIENARTLADAIEKSTQFKDAGGKSVEAKQSRNSMATYLTILSSTVIAVTSIVL